MFIEDKKIDNPINELNLGSQLNECVQNKKHSEFSLLLKMLTDDVQFHPQFLLPKTRASNTKDNSDTLRLKLNLPDVQPLSISECSEIAAYNQADLILHNSQHTLHLNNALKPLPLAFRDSVNHIPTNIVDNTSIHCRKRLKQSVSDNKITTGLPFKANEWLSTVNNCIDMFSGEIAEATAVTV